MGATRVEIFWELLSHAGLLTSALGPAGLVGAVLGVLLVKESGTPAKPKEPRSSGTLLCVAAVVVVLLMAAAR
ncbi:hypothetical protein [Streptomyces sp. CBMA152]|uniref:hypothetical protein n=1 Tax=Streptomyces sp. CBMA152 TaxID=1896312 RepID=UPI0016606BBD|nr:hypothetical protein [Streptomyces sp. CBMA152]MBD0746974.1 hypothetical protein [Streptomyces sp. CBMA152]